MASLEIPVGIVLRTHEGKESRGSSRRLQPCKRKVQQKRNVCLKEGTHVVQVNVDTPIVCEDEVANCVCALDRMRVIIESFQEPRILRSYEFSRLGIGPHLWWESARPRSNATVEPEGKHTRYS